MIEIKSPREIKLMAEACRLAYLAMMEMSKHIEANITTIELDYIAETFIRKHGALPAFKGYQGFPNTVCASINNVVVHGIPDQTKLAPGDIISLDVGTKLNGFHGDCARTFPVGKISPTAEKLLAVTRESLKKGIDAVKAGARLSDISYAVQSFVEKNGFSVVKDYVGHGIGRKMHEPPQIPNFGPPNRGVVLREGMTLAIEPMVNLGDSAVITQKDGWAVITKDQSLSAHFEDTIAVTKTGAKVLTADLIAQN